jgi:hypothetical protein
MASTWVSCEVGGSREPWGSNLGKVPSGGPQEALKGTGACVKVGTRDRSRRVDGHGIGLWARGTRRIEGGEGTARGPQEAVKAAVCVIVVSSDCSRRVDDDRGGARRAELCGADGARGIDIW